MKKFVSFLIVLFIASGVCFADELLIDKDTVFQKKIMQTGFRILNGSNMEQRYTFSFNPENKIKISHKHKSSIIVYKGLFPLIEDDNELAALLSREIAYTLDLYHGYFRWCATGYSPLKYEKKADLKAADLMVNAGYNPVALIVILNKSTQENSWVDVLHHKGSQRTLYVYKHIYEKYPVYLSDNEYLKNPYYQNFLHNTKNERKRIRKLQQERIKLHSEKKKV